MRAAWSARWVANPRRTAHAAGDHALAGDQPAIYSKSFDSVKDFQTIATLASRVLMIVPTKLPAKDLGEFIALAERSPMRDFASSATARSTLLAELKSESGIKMCTFPIVGVARQAPA